MTATRFNPATCSAQDWATRLASFDAVLAACSLTPEARETAAARFADQLHLAMGYRSDHADLALGLEF